MKWWYTYNKYIHELTDLILIFFSSFDLTIIANFDRTDKTFRRAARTFWGSGRFLQIRAQIHNSSERLNYMQTLQRPSFKNNYLFQIQIFLVDIQARSSNVNEVIRAVLNSLFFYYWFFFFFYEKTLHAPKAPKAQRRNQAKAQNATSEQ